MLEMWVNPVLSVYVLPPTINPKRFCVDPDKGAEPGIFVALISERDNFIPHSLSEQMNSTEVLNMYMWRSMIFMYLACI